MSSAKIQCIDATVYEESEYYNSVVAQRKHAPSGPAVRTPPGSERSGVRVVLCAVLDDGQRITEEGCLGVGGPRNMRMSEVREHMDIGLGRDPDLHSPTPLGWGRLIEALESSQLVASEAELIAAPLEFHLSDGARQMLTLD